MASSSNTDDSADAPALVASLQSGSHDMDLGLNK